MTKPALKNQMTMTNDELQAIRSACGRIAATRDQMTCMIHFWAFGKPGVRGTETHHILGRGSIYKPELEHWLLRITICDECHYKRHHGDGIASFNEVYAAIMATCNPRMVSFGPETGRAVTIDEPSLFHLIVDHHKAARELLSREWYQARQQIVGWYG